jgi:hypothetical protein
VIFLSSSTFCSTSSFLTRSVQLISIRIALLIYFDGGFGWLVGWFLLRYVTLLRLILFLQWLHFVFLVLRNSHAGLVTACLVCLPPALPDSPQSATCQFWNDTPRAYTHLSRRQV